MARTPKVSWSEKNRAWKSDSGPHNEAGRRMPVYFRGIAGDAKGRREAQARLEQYVRERDAREKAEAISSASPSCLEVVALYLQHCRAKVRDDELSQETVRSHAERLRRFLNHVGADDVPMSKRRAATVTDDDVARWLTQLAAGGAGPKRRDGLLRTCKACWAWAAAAIPGRTPKTLVAHNPFLEIAGPTLPATGKPFIDPATFATVLRYGWRRANAWTPIEGGRCSGCVRAKTFQGHCRRSHSPRQHYFRAMVLLWRVQYHAGPRPKDLCQAVWRDPTNPAVGWFPEARQDENGHWWGLIVVPGKTTRATGRLREIWVSPILRRAIERVRQHPLHPTYIFAARSRDEGGSRAWTSLKLAQRFGAWRNEARALRKADGSPKYHLPGALTLYGCRHTWYSTAVFEAGQSSEQAGAAGGTSGKTVEANYAKARRAATFGAATATNRARRASARRRGLKDP